MRRYHAPLDPECPEVEHFYESLDADPMTAYSGVGDEISRGLRGSAPRDVRALPALRRGAHRGRGCLTARRRRGTATRRTRWCRRCRRRSGAGR